MIELLLELKELGHTILISAHNLESIATFCDRTVFAYGATQEVFTAENLHRTLIVSIFYQTVKISL